MKDSILNINVSCFAHCKATTPSDVNLLVWLTSNKHRDKVEQIRKLQDEGLQKEIKKTLPAITPSGRFLYRDTDHLIEHTGFITFDIDADKNPHISDFAKVRDQISHIKNVAYCGLSVRGRGCWGLVPIPKSTPKEHKQRFDALAKDFAAFGLILDPACSDVCRLRIYSWDPDAYFNHSAEIYTKAFRHEAPRLPRPPAGDTRDKVEAVISQIKERQIDMTQDYKGEWFGLAAALANEFGEGGRGYFHTLSMFHSGYDVRATDKMFDGVLKRRYEKWSIGTLFALAKNYGITLKPEPAPAIREKTVKTVTAPEPAQTKERAPDIWGVAELEAFFRSKELPHEPVRLDSCTLITDPALFVSTEIAIVRANNGNSRFLPYLDRLQQLKILLS